MNRLRCTLILIFAFAAHAAYANCPAYSGQGSARDALRKLYMQNCLGYENDTAQITKAITEKLATVDASKLPLKSSDDITVLERKVAELIDEIEASLASAPRDSDFSPLFSKVLSQMNDDRSKVLTSHEHPAAPWVPDNMKILADQVDIGAALDAACQSSDEGITERQRCLLAFEASKQLIRHSILMKRLLFESNSHIPKLAARYKLLDEKWDYYFGKARSQYIWEFKLNSSLYHSHLIKLCQDDFPHLKSRKELEKTCANRADVRLEAPPNGQWILFHPSAALEYTSHDDSGDTANHSVAIVEILGYNKFGSDSKFPLNWPIGGSVITTVSLDSNGSRFGWGAMLHVRNNLSIAVARRKFGGKTETTWLITADLMKLFLEKKADAKQKFEFLK